MAKFYVTTPIYYVNDIPHLGHAYTTVAADVVARYHRLLGDDVLFLTGSDEHGQKVEKSALDQNLTPIQLADKVVVRFSDLWKRLNISNDDFIRTTEERHDKVVKALWIKLEEKGDIYLDEYEGWYCTHCETFWTDGQLDEEKCPDCHREVHKLKEESYFFKLSAYQEKLLNFFEDNPDFVKPASRRNEILSFINSGLKDISISRTSFKWGIKVPTNEEHVVYVWFDALFNYVTAAGYIDDKEKFKKFWPANLHLIGKDIIRFHAVFWPAFLMAAELEIPKRVFAHGWWTVEGQKMSKSLRNVVDPNMLIDMYGVEPLRYFILREVPFGNDGDFSHKAFIHRYNSDLVNDLGNLVKRVISMNGKYFKGVVPDYIGKRDSVEDEFRETVLTEINEYHKFMEQQEFHKALAVVWKIISKGNVFVDKSAPWELNKTGEKEKLGRVLFDLLESIKISALLIAPYMPDTSNKIIANLGLEIDKVTYEDLNFNTLKSGSKLNKAVNLYNRIDEEKAMEELQKNLEKTKESKENKSDENVNVVTTEDFVNFNYFKKIDLRVAKVINAEKVKKSKKLLKLRLEVGELGERTIVAGISQHYSEEDIIGKLIIIVANLEPAKLMGIESQGMLLAATGSEKLKLLTVESEIESGSKIG